MHSPTDQPDSQLLVGEYNFDGFLCLWQEPAPGATSVIGRVSVKKRPAAYARAKRPSGNTAGVEVVNDDTGCEKVLEADAASVAPDEHGDETVNEKKLKKPPGYKDIQLVR